MGIKMFDLNSIGHLCGGILACSLCQYINIPVLYNFIITNGIHLIIEKIERNVAPNGDILETRQNHIGDIIAFFLGWMIAYYFKFDRFIYPNNVSVLWIILLFFTMNEFLREIFPYKPLLSGAYIYHLHTNTNRATEL